MCLIWIPAKVGVKKKYSTVVHFLVALNLLLYNNRPTVDFRGYLMPIMACISQGQLSILPSGDGYRWIWTPNISFTLAVLVRSSVSTSIVTMTSHPPEKVWNEKNKNRKLAGWPTSSLPFEVGNRGEPLRSVWLKCVFKHFQLTGGICCHLKHTVYHRGPRTEPQSSAAAAQTMQQRTHTSHLFRIIQGREFLNPCTTKTLPHICLQWPCVSHFYENDLLLHSCLLDSLHRTGVRERGWD